ncbi:MAG: ATP/GTP-binding protein [candidate division KSB1 bacterium]|nr:ATP/GTP-binding protein [candidate division KSB1 bacterium]MDZ7275799.1 ATP/GTP-binding protein [candidate division KSB1 bacterium]MDZ7287551.1 ATP/GTP-binding protein [candidate division KSB1 bacterium]MDZ7308045.1 ATP/GTP-binding protein [candidate division KSB1 bacterium]MDZ7350529.1 ATP/GTP-binding protein [candidate division KSB1 bacterium]
MTTIQPPGASLAAHFNEAEFNRALKIVVTGPFGSGKTRFIGTVSDIKTLQTEVPCTAAKESDKLMTTVALDFGMVRLNPGATAYLFGTPGQARFEFMWEILATGMQGLIFLVDSTDADSFEEARVMLDYFCNCHPVPLVVGANKQDLMRAQPPETIRSALALPPEVPILPINAVQKESAMQAVRAVAAMLHRQR